MSSAHSQPVARQPAPARRRRPNRPRNGDLVTNMQRLNLSQVGSNDAMCRVKRTEWLSDVTTESNTFLAKGFADLEVDGKNLPVLSQLSKLFDRFVVHSIVLIYRGAVATTRDGVVYFGIDYDSQMTLDKISDSTVLKFPNKSCSVWEKEVRLPLQYEPSVRYVKGKDFRDLLGRAIWSASSDKKVKLGTIFVYYDVTLLSLSASD